MNAAELSARLKVAVRENRQGDEAGPTKTKLYEMCSEQRGGPKNHRKARKWRKEQGKSVGVDTDPCKKTVGRSRYLEHLEKGRSRRDSVRWIQGVQGKRKAEEMKAYSGATLDRHKRYVYNLSGTSQREQKGGHLDAAERRKLGTRPRKRSAEPTDHLGHRVPQREGMTKGRTT